MAESLKVLVSQLCPTLFEPTRLLCPWDSPGKNAGVRCHALLQEILSTQERNPRLLCLLHWQASSQRHLGSPSELEFYDHEYNIEPF